MYCKFTFILLIKSINKILLLIDRKNFDSKLVHVQLFLCLQGRNGKGVIYVRSAGNGKHLGDTCATDGDINTELSIAITSADQHGRPAYYSERCAAVLAATYSGSHLAERIVSITHTNIIIYLYSISIIRLHLIIVTCLCVLHFGKIYVHYCKNNAVIKRKSSYIYM